MTGTPFTNGRDTTPAAAPAKRHEPWKAAVGVPRNMLDSAKFFRLAQQVAADRASILADRPGRTPLAAHYTDALGFPVTRQNVARALKVNGIQYQARKAAAPKTARAPKAGSVRARLAALAAAVADLTAARRG
jgi:hypothetical protein